MEQQLSIVFSYLSEVVCSTSFRRWSICSVSNVLLSPFNWSCNLSMIESLSCNRHCRFETFVFISSTSLFSCSISTVYKVRCATGTASEVDWLLTSRLLSSLWCTVDDNSFLVASNDSNRYLPWVWIVKSLLSLTFLAHHILPQLWACQSPLRDVKPICFIVLHDKALLLFTMNLSAVSKDWYISTRNKSDEMKSVTRYSRLFDYQVLYKYHSSQEQELVWKLPFSSFFFFFIKYKIHWKSIESISSSGFWGV